MQKFPCLRDNRLSELVINIQIKKLYILQILASQVSLDTIARYPHMTSVQTWNEYYLKVIKLVNVPKGDQKVNQIKKLIDSVEDESKFKFIFMKI